MTDAHQRAVEMMRFVGFDEADSRTLAQLRAGLDRVRSRLIDDFYGRILADPGARAVLKNESRVAGLRVSLDAWLSRLFENPLDEAWLARRAQIGRRHVEVELPQRYMPLAINVVREHLVGVAIEDSAGDVERLRRSLLAVDRILALELTVMLDTYHEDKIQRMKQVERLATISQLAASVSHELKDPIGVVNTSLFLLRESLKGLAPETPVASVAAELRDHLDRIARAARRASELTDQLVDYARVRTVTRQWIPIAAIVDDVIRSLDPPESIRIERDGAREATVFADPALLQRVLVNVLRNSIQAITGAPAGSGSGLVRVMWDEDQGFDRIEVRDDGPGVPAGIAPRIFEPMFTTRAHGAGLGLASCRALIQAHGGTIELIDRVDHGATIRIRLPRRD